MNHPQYGNTANVPVILTCDAPCVCVCVCQKMWDPLLMHLVIPKILCDCMHSINAHIQLYWHRTNSLHLCLHMECNSVGLSWSSRSWHVHLLLLTYSWHVEPSHDQCLLHKQHHGWHTTTYEFQQVDNLLLRETELLPSGPIWMDSPPHMRSWICIVMLYILATHSVNCTFLHMWVQVCLLSQMCSWTSYPATATP
jgi:hypothetical protein